MNVYEETLDEQDPVDNAAQADPNPYLETLDAVESSRTRAMRQAAIKATDESPDQAAKVRKLSELTGLAPELVARDYDRLSKRQAADGTPFSKIIEETPTLAEWSTESNNASIAQDDMEALGTLEWLVTAPQRAFARSIHHMRVAELRAQQLYRTLTQEELDRLNSEKFAAEAGGALGVGDSWFRKGVSGGGELLANILGATYSAGPKAILGGVVGGAIGATGGALAGGVGAVPGAIAGAKFGFTAGATVGGAQFGFELEAGLALDEFLDPKWKDEYGQPMDPDVARGAAMAAGAMNAGLEVVGLGILARSFPGVEKLKGIAARHAIKEALKNPTVRSAIKDAVKSYGGVLTGETAVEVAQRAVTIMAGEIGKQVDGQGARQLSAGEIAADLASEAAGALAGFSFLAPAGPVMRLARDVSRLQRSDQQAAFFQALAEGATASKTIQRSPEAAQAFLERATKDGPIPEVYAPTAPFREFFQSQGMKPEDVAAELTGRADALEEAERTGADLPIKTSVYAVRMAGTPFHAGLAQHLRLGPDEMNAVEAQAFREKVAAELDQAKTDVAGSRSQQIRDQLLAQLEDAGVPTAAAQAYATLYESAFGAMAERAGVDPVELYARYGLTVNQPDVQEGAPAGQAAPGGESVAPDEGQGTSEVEELLRAAVQPDIRHPGMDTGQAAAEAPAAGPATDPDAPLDTTDPVKAALAMMREDPQIMRKGEELRARAAANRAPAPKRDGTPAQPGVESPAPDASATAQAGEPATSGEEPATAVGGEQLRGDEAQPVPAADGGLQPAGGEGARPGQGRRRPVPASQRERVGKLLADARARGFTGTDRDFVAAFLERYDTAVTIAADLEQDANLGGWRSLLVRISQAGGIGLDDFEADRGETMPILDLLAKGSGIIKKSGRYAVKRQGQRVLPNSVGIKGAPGIVVRKGGRSWDDMRDILATDPDFPAELRERWQDLSNFQNDVNAAAVNGRAENMGEPIPGRATPDVVSVLEQFLEVTEGSDWWQEQSPLQEEYLESADAATFDPSEFEQTLFDDLLEPDVPAQREEQVDLLETGEQQPRLPGAGQVRETETATPEFEAPFSLTAPIDKSKKGKQTTLFQAGPDRQALQSALEQFRQDMKDRHPDLLELDLYVTSAGDIELDTLAVKAGSAPGTGTAVMKALTTFADATGKRILLSPAPRGFQPVGGRRTSSYARLVDFYRRFGFVRNTGRNRDFTTTKAMIRPPQERTFFQTEPRGFKLVTPHLTAQERATRKDRAIARVVEVFKTLPPDADYEAVALAGQAARGWYARSSDAIRDVFGETDAPRFIALLAALSPRVKVRENLENTLRTWVAWLRAGRPTDRKAILKILAKSVRGGQESSVLESWKNNTVEALSYYDPHGIVLSGPKVQSFAMNLKGYFDEVTNDAWMATFAGIEQTLFKGKPRVLQQLGRPKRKIGDKTPGYIAAAAKVRRVAARLTELTGEKWTPAEVQETVWSWTMTLDQLSRDTGKSAEELVRSGELTDEVIASAPDFGRFITGDPTVRGILRVAGYGPQLQAIEEQLDERRAAPGRSDRPAGRGGAGESRQDRSPTLAELRSARRLDASRGARGEAVELFQSAVPDNQPIELFQPAWHGTPHAFEKFSLQAIGTGEGAQVYGWGIYFTDTREIAEYYRDVLTQRDSTSTQAKAAQLVRLNKGNVDQAVKSLNRRITAMQRYLELDEQLAPIIDAEPFDRALFDRVQGERDTAWQMTGQPAWLPRDEIQQRIAEDQDIVRSMLSGDYNTGRVYKVEIPDGSEMLQWDLPASQQPAKVQAALRELGVTWTPFRVRTMGQMSQWLNGPTAAALAREDIGMRESLGEAFRYLQENDEVALRNWQWKHQGFFNEGNQDPIGSRIYEQLKSSAVDARYAEFRKTGGRVFNQPTTAEAAAHASELLAKAGVPGIRYLDGSSRRAGSGGYNYVVFDDKLIQIQEFFQPFFHGSPHNIKGRMSTKHVGSGEGAASYGWGLYFAENPAVAAHYFDSLSDDPQILEMRIGRLRVSERNGFDYTKWAHVSDLENIRASLTEDLLSAPLDLLGFGAAKFPQLVLAKLDERIADLERGGYTSMAAAGRQLREELARPGATSVKWDERQGGVYQVEVADEHVAAMLDWDAPLEQQTPAVQAAVRKLGLPQASVTIEQVGNGYQIHFEGRPVGVPYNRRVDAESRVQHGFRDDTGASIPGSSGQGIYHALVDKLVDEKTRDLDALRRALEIPRADRGGQVAVNALGAPERHRYVDIRPGKQAEWEALGERIQELEQQGKRLASETLHAEGIPGIKYLDQWSRDGSSTTSRNIVVFHDDVVELTHKDGTPLTAQERSEYFQDKEERTGAAKDPGKRGSITFDENRQVTINLFAKMDLSTFLHEGGHFFLEVMGDLVDQVAQLPEHTAQQKVLLTDYKALLDWFGVQNRYQITTEHHERFARAFEAYLMEGKAPTLELRSMFARFRAWLIGIYRSMNRLNVQLNDDVRAVMDRMLATDQAIEEAEAQGRIEPLFSTPASAGMTPGDFELYRAQMEAAHRTARERLEQKLLSEVFREQQQAWRDRRDEIEAEVTAQLAQLPVYRVMEAARTGRTPDGKPLTPEGEELVPLKISKKMLVDQFGKARVQALPRPPIYSVDGGLDPDGMAQTFGYDAADGMLTAIEQAVPFKQAVKAETDRRMLAEHGSILLDGSLLEDAQASIANEDREILIRAELRALASMKRKVAPFVAAERAKGQARVEAERAKTQEAQQEASELKARARGGAAYMRGAVPNPQDLREMAERRIRAMRIADIKPAPFWSASRRAAQRAVELAARQDLDGAIVAKQQELLNLALYREATRVLEDVDKRVRKAKSYGTPSARARFGTAGEAYLDQVDGILDRYEFTRVSAKVLARRASIARFVAALEGEGLPVDLPPEVLEDTRRINYREIPYEELVGVTDGLEQIAHLARLKNKLLKNKEQRELEAVAGELAESIRENARGSAPEVIRDRRPSVERRRSVADFFGSHRKLASILRQLDGFKDGGAAWAAIMRPLNDAGSREAEMQAEATRKLQAIIDRAFPGAAAKQRLYDKTYIEAVGRSLSRMERLMIAMNWGNEGNRDRLRRAEKWNDAQVQAILDTLSGAELTFVQDVLDYINSYWPQIAEKEKRVTGLAPEKVLAVPIKAAGGEIRGGYFPIKPDDRLSAKATGLLDLESANLAKHAAFAGATTKRGHTKQRAESGKLPMRRDFGVIWEHLNQVIHDLSHHETLIDVTRVLGHAEVQAAILEKYGDRIYKQIRNTIRDVAYGDIPAVNGFERAVNHVRMGATVASLAWKFSVSAMQLTGLTNSMVRIGPTWVGRGIVRWFRHPTAMNETVGWIHEVSPFMRSRARTMQRELLEIRNQVGVESGTLKGWVDRSVETVGISPGVRQGIADSYFWMIQKMQQVVDVPTWLGAYQKALNAGHPEDRAIAMADQAVLDSQGGGQIKDLAQVQRGGPMMKLWTNFYSFFNVLYNQAAESAHRTNLKNPVEVGRLAADYFMLFILPASLGFLLREALSTRDREDEEPEDFVKRLAFENISYVAGTMLGVREVAGVFAGAAGYEGPAGARAFASLTRLGVQTKQIVSEYAEEGEVDDTLDAAFFRSLNDVAGTVLHYPASQSWNTIAGIVGLAEGKTDNPMAVVSGPPPKGR